MARLSTILDVCNATVDARVKLLAINLVNLNGASETKVKQIVSGVERGAITADQVLATFRENTPNLTDPETAISAIREICGASPVPEGDLLGAIQAILWGQSPQNVLEMAKNAQRDYASFRA